MFPRLSGDVNTLMSTTYDSDAERRFSSAMFPRRFRNLETSVYGLPLMLRSSVYNVIVGYLFKSLFAAITFIVLIAPLLSLLSG